MSLYFDNAATMPVHPKALAAMLPFLEHDFGNPSSVYAAGRKVRQAIDESRKIVADAIGASPDEIHFTSGGTEADNWAVRGVLEWKGAGRGTMPHVITSSVEHHAIHDLCEYLAKQGFCTVTFIPVDAQGLVSLDAIESAITPDTCLISVMSANNEIGTIQPIKEISAIAKKHNVIFHTDAVCCVGHTHVDVNEWGVDALSLSAHKFGGPKGAGALYVRKGTRISPIFRGGAQEKSRRPGTENVIGIIGMGAALTVSLEDMHAEAMRQAELRDTLIKRILEEIPHTILNGPPPGENRLPSNVNISFRFIEGESLLLHLDMQGCAASTGSACSSGSLDPSHVLMAIGLDHELANGAIRFSLGRNNTAEDIDKLVSILKNAVSRLRDLSPLYDDYVKSEN